VLLGSALGAASLAAQAPARTPGTIQYPGEMVPGKIRTAFGVSAISMPAALVQEAAAIRWPMFSLDVVMGLPRDFVLAGTISSEIATNHFELSARWQAPLTDRLRADVGLGGALWFGQLKRFVFDNNVRGRFLYPSASIGYDFGTMTLTASAKASFIGSLHARTGELEAASTNNVYNGMSWRVSLEQPFSKHTTVGVSFQMNHLKFYYPQWPLFPTFDHRFWIPEAQIRVTL
jgi:hypothetical protein